MGRKRLIIRTVLTYISFPPSPSLQKHTCVPSFRCLFNTKLPKCRAMKLKFCGLEDDFQRSGQCCFYVCLFSFFVFLANHSTFYFLVSVDLISIKSIKNKSDALRLTYHVFYYQFFSGHGVWNELESVIRIARNCDWQCAGVKNQNLTASTLWV